MTWTCWAPNPSIWFAVCSGAVGYVIWSHLRRYGRPYGPVPRLLAACHQALLLRLEKRRDDFRVELRERVANDLLDRDVVRQLAPVRPVRRHRNVGVGDGEDTGANRDVVAPETVRIALAIEALVVVTDDGSYVA